MPESYLAGWARLQVQTPLGVSEAMWRQAINDVGQFLDAWGGLAIEFGWTSRNLFGPIGNGQVSGLAWFLNGEAVRALGPEHAVTQSGLVFDRLTLPRRN